MSTRVQQGICCSIASTEAYHLHIGRSSRLKMKAATYIHKGSPFGPCHTQADYSRPHTHWQVVVSRTRVWRIVKTLLDLDRPQQTQQILVDCDGRQQTLIDPFKSYKTLLNSIRLWQTLPNLSRPQHTVANSNKSQQTRVNPYRPQ